MLPIQLAIVRRSYISGGRQATAEDVSCPEGRRSRISRHFCPDPIQFD